MTTTAAVAVSGVEVAGKVIRESEKAILFEVASEAGQVARVWFPKSRVQMASASMMIVPEWLLEAKESEAGFRFLGE